MGKKKHRPARHPRAKAPGAGGGPGAPAVPAPAGDLALALGAAVYTTDVVLPHMLHVAVARSPFLRARLRALDLAAAGKAPGVAAVRALREAGSELTQLGEEVALIAAATRDQARHALALVRPDLEPLPPAEGPVLAAKPPADEAFGAPLKEGEPEAVLGGAAFRSKEAYGWERQSYAEQEPHAFVCEPVGDGLHVWAASDDPARLAGELAAGLSLPAGKVKVDAPHVGAIFGGRGRLAAIDLACARLSLELKAPLRLVFDRLSERVVGGHRGASFAEVEVGADKDGHVTSWRSRSWSASPVPPPLPYLFRAPHRSSRHATVAPEAPLAAGEAEAAAAYFAGCALDDLAALMGQSPLDVLPLSYSLAEPFADRFAALLAAAAGEARWKTRWHPRGDVAEGPVRRGMGLGFGLWGETAAGPLAKSSAAGAEPTAPAPPNDPVGPPEPKPPGAESGAQEPVPMAAPAAGESPKHAEAQPVSPAAVPAAASTGLLAVVVAEVSVDRQTGIVAVDKLYVAGEVQPGAPQPARRLVEAALARGAVQGGSQALFEEGDRGQVAGACEVGKVSVQLVEAPGLASASLPGAVPAARFAAPAAVANALANALGRRLPLLPITPEKVLAALAPPSPPAPPAVPPPAPAAAPPPAPASPPSVVAPEGGPAPPAPTPPASGETEAKPAALPPADPPPDPPIPPPGWRGGA